MRRAVRSLGRALRRSSHWRGGYAARFGSGRNRDAGGTPLHGLEAREQAMSTRSRIGTVTLNPAVDRTLTVPGFAAGAVNRVVAEESHAGGKGVNVASFLADAGFEVVASGVLGRENAGVFERHFRAKSIEDRFVRIAGRTRVGLKIADPESGQTTDINFAGQTPTEAESAVLFERVGESAGRCGWMAVCGSVPAGLDGAVYGRLIDAMRGCGCRVAVDTSGEALRRAVERRPDAIKPNREELAELTGVTCGTVDEAARAGRELRDSGVGLVVVSLGGEGAVFVGEEEAWHAVPPVVAVRSTVGAGDAMLAGVVAARARGMDLRATARLSTAWAASAVTRVTMDLGSPEQIERLTGAVRLVSC